MDVTKEIEILEQIIREDKHSSRHLWTVIKADADIKNAHKEKMIQRIQKYMDGDYWASKNERIKILAMNFDIEELVVAICASVFYEAQNRVPIHPVINRMHSFPSYLEDLDSIKTSAELLEACDGIVYDIYRDETLSIKSKYFFCDKTLLRIKDFATMEPMVCEPVPWKNNYNGGFITHKTSAILQAKKVYDGPLGLDVLNKLQSIETSAGYFVWRYDSRGRFYNVGYQHNFQGDDIHRSKILFEKGEYL